MHSLRHTYQHLSWANGSLSSETHVLWVTCDLRICVMSVGTSISLYIACFSSVQSLSCVQLFVTLWTAACQASLSITTNSYQNSNGIFYRNRKNTLETYMELQKTPNSQTWENNKAMVLYFLIPSYTKAVVIKTVLYSHRQLIYDKGGKNIQWEKSLFNKWCWERWTATCKRMKSGHSLTPHTKVKLKLVLDLKIRLYTV